MDTVTFDGVEFVKASVIAKQFRYTADYVGQLCRGRKVDSRLVGRTWFVNPRSLTAHKETRHQKPVSDRQQTVSVEQVGVNEIRLSRKTEILPHQKVSILKQPSNKLESRERHLKVSYEPDEELLIPTLHKKEIPAPRVIRIEHVDAKKIAVSGGKKETTFEAEEMPEVALSGKVAVIDYSEESEAVSGKVPTEQVSKESQTESSRDSFNNKDITVNPNEKIRSEIETLSKQKESRKVSANENSVHEKTGRILDNKKQLQPVEGTSLRVASDLPTRVDIPKSDTKTSTTSFTPAIIKQRSAQKVSVFVLMSPLIASLLAVGCVSFIWFASTSVVVTDSVYESHLVLQVANLLELLQR